MTAACIDTGLAPPVLGEVGPRFRVTIRSERVAAPSLDATDRAILDFLAGDEGHLTGEVAKAVDLSPRATRTRLASLVERGLVSEIGTSPNDPTRRYFSVDRP